MSRGHKGDRALGRAGRDGRCDTASDGSPSTNLSTVSHGKGLYEERLSLLVNSRLSQADRDDGELIQALGDDLSTAFFMASDALAIGAAVSSGAPNRSS